jgi:FKBP-type peptidyl-prolyl cis-trans isomerase (trigger factor)
MLATPEVTPAVLPVGQSGQVPQATRAQHLTAESLDALEEQILHRVLQRIDLSLERRLREAVATLVLQHTQNLVPRLREEIEFVVRQAVSEAVADELAVRQGP